MPFIMYIPDAIDPEIKNVYESKYYELINSLKNGTIIFENKYHIYGCYLRLLLIIVKINII